MNYQNEYPGKVSGRHYSPVGDTDSSKYNAGNGWNGAGSDAYSWCHEKAGWQKTAGYSGATISSDLMLCENAQRMSLIVALGVGGGGATRTNSGMTTGINRIANQIANGHAFYKHAKEFGVESRGEFANIIRKIMHEPTEFKELERGRSAYWHEELKSVVVHDPNSADGGTIFRARPGRLEKLE